MGKTQQGVASGAASTEVEQTKALPDSKTGLAVTGDGDVSGPIAIALSQAMADQIALELQEALHQVETGFGSLTNPTDIAAMGIPFDVIDAMTITDYEDRQKGEILTKHIFQLEFADGQNFFTMQGDARPRRALAQVFQKARALGHKLRVGPYLYVQKPIPGQRQPAWIFAQQPGFKAVPQQQVKQING